MFESSSTCMFESSRTCMFEKSSRICMFESSKYLLSNETENCPSEGALDTKPNDLKIP